MPLFRANGFYLNSDFEHLLELSGDDFKAMGVKKGVCMCVLFVCTRVVYYYTNTYVFATIQFLYFLLSINLAHIKVMLAGLQHTRNPTCRELLVDVSCHMLWT